MKTVIWRSPYCQPQQVPYRSIDWRLMTGWRDNSSECEQSSRLMWRGNVSITESSARYFIRRLRYRNYWEGLPGISHLRWRVLLFWAEGFCSWEFWLLRFWLREFWPLRRYRIIGGLESKVQVLMYNISAYIGLLIHLDYSEPQSPWLCSSRR